MPSLFPGVGTLRWQNPQPIDAAKPFTCGHCGLRVAASSGFVKVDGNNIPREFACICPHCEKITYFDVSDKQMPGPVYGTDVGGLPPDVGDLYREARNCMQVTAYTACTLAARKLLMNIAVTCGAKPGESFQTYVNYLAENGYVPPKAKGWIDHIRTKGNEATHEIPSIKSGDAADLLSFMEMILKIVYDYPSRVPSGSAAGS
jgi:hypothetical protein